MEKSFRVGDRRWTKTTYYGANGGSTERYTLEMPHGEFNLQIVCGKIVDLRWRSY